MIEKIKPWIQGKRVLLLGFGREGQSTYHVLRQVRGYEKLDIADVSSPASRPDEDGLWITGPDYQKCLDNYDVVFKSPGIVLEKPAEEYKCRILSQTEVFFQLFRDQIIGITGTKGKSTVTTLLYHILKNAGMDTMILGNIGIPALDLSLIHIWWGKRILCPAWQRWSVPACFFRGLMQSPAALCWER